MANDIMSHFLLLGIYASRLKTESHSDPVNFKKEKEGERKLLSQR